MYSRRARRASRRRPASQGPVRRWWLVAGGTSIPVLVVAYAFVTPHGERAVDTASVSVPAAEADTGGWGEGGYTMMPAPAPGAANAANATGAISENWAGYTSAGSPGTFTNVSASWAQPTVTCTATDTFASFWVGLDGDGTSSVEQTGTEADCTGGAAAYQGWFEMFPQAPVFYDNPVQPGDAMSASVVANGGGAFTLTLTDSTQGWSQTTSQTSNIAQLGSAEVIAEAPSDGTGAVLPLSNFGTVSFTNATVDNTAMGNENPGALTMVSASDLTEATPSALTGGNAFTVTWDSSGTTGTAIATAVPTSPAAGPAPGSGGTPGRHHHRHWFDG